MINIDKSKTISHIKCLAGDYKCYDNTLSHEEALELNEMINELQKLREYHDKWVEMTDILRDENGNRLEIGDLVDFKVNVTDWGRHRNGIDPNNLETNGNNIIAKLVGTINFDDYGREFYIETDYYFLPSIHISCIEEGSLQLHIGKDLEQSETHEDTLKNPSECNEEEMER